MAKRGQNEGSIYQRNDGRWVGVVNLGWQGGKRVRKSYYGATRKEVQEQLTKALSDLQKGLPVVVKEQTVAQYLEWWLREVAQRTIRPSTFASYSQIVRLYLVTKASGSWQPDAVGRAVYEHRKNSGKLKAGEVEPAVRAHQYAIGAVKLSKLTGQHVRSLLNEMQSMGLSARTVQYTHAILRRALETAVMDDVIARNVAALVQPPRVVAKEVQPLTPEEARRFLAAVEGDPLAALFTVAVSLGLRQGEALALRWRDVDLEAGKLRVRYALQRFTRTAENEPCKTARRSTEIHLVEPKTRKSRRVVDLPSVAVEALAAHRARQDEQRILAASQWKSPTVNCEGRVETVEDFVFTSSIGTPLEKCNVTKRFQGILKAAGIPHHRFHDLRHTAATLLAVQGVHPKAIQSVLGWEQLGMVDRYTHFVDEMRKEAANQMDAILNPVAVNAAVKRSAQKVN